MPSASWETVLEAARTKGLQLEIQKAGSITEIDTAYASLAQLHAGALIVAADPFFVSQREQLAALASRHAMPSIYPMREYVTAGGPDKLRNQPDGYISSD